MPPIRSPFERLTTLLGDTPPGATPIALSVGEPQHPVPAFVGPVLAAALADFGRYPGIRGTPAFRTAVAAWAGQRYPGVRLDPEREILVLSGSREGLVSLALAARGFAEAAGRDRVLMPNPFYPPYVAAAHAIGAEPVFLPATAATGHLPDLNALPAATLARTLLMFLCSPANPQGAVADRAYLHEALALARRHGFLLVADECYSEIYDRDPPPGGLEVAAETGSLARLVVMNSLSKRSSLAGLRVGFAAGDPDIIARWAAFRNVTAPQTPLPLQAVAAAAYGDETHVEANRALYRAKIDAAERLLGNRYGPIRPPGGFFLWLDLDGRDEEEAARRAWARGGVRVVPGRYLAEPDAEGVNPGAGHLRIALTPDLASTETALRRLADALA